MSYLFFTNLNLYLQPALHSSRNKIKLFDLTFLTDLLKPAITNDLASWGNTTSCYIDVLLLYKVTVANVLASSSLVIHLADTEQHCYSFGVMFLSKI